MIAPSSVVSPQASRNRRTEENEGADVEECSAFDPPTVCCAIAVFLSLQIVVFTPLLKKAWIGIHSCLGLFGRSMEQGRRYSISLSLHCLARASPDGQFLVTLRGYLFFLKHN